MLVKLCYIELGFHWDWWPFMGTGQCGNSPSCCTSRRAVACFATEKVTMGLPSQTAWQFFLWVNGLTTLVKEMSLLPTLLLGTWYRLPVWNLDVENLDKFFWEQCCLHTIIITALTAECSQNHHQSQGHKIQAVGSTVYLSIHCTIVFVTSRQFLVGLDQWIMHVSSADQELSFFIAHLHFLFHFYKFCFMPVLSWWLLEC